jgi:hypothetical protein
MNQKINSIDKKIILFLKGIGCRFGKAITEIKKKRKKVTLLF